MQPPSDEHESRRYGISADELHEEIVARLRSFGRHMSFDLDGILEREAGRPLTQTVTMALMRAYHKGMSKNATAE